MANQVTAGDNTGGVIPYKNAPALIAYYLAVFSLIPILGVLLGAPAVVLGILGLKKRREQPAVRGAAHAWIGIVLGSITTLLWGGIVVLMVLSIFAAGRR
jgi:hypothetical protein